ncbi:hypothetical protein JHW43_005950 [Diplocarpon mali]|nr:hypothetical protein JHW43_005950 [Diplocarpon mali]
MPTRRTQSLPHIPPYVAGDPAGERTEREHDCEPAAGSVGLGRGVSAGRWEFDPYPNVGTPGPLDYTYLCIAGHVRCSQHAISQVRSYSEPAYVLEIQDTSEYYASLHPNFPSSEETTLDYANAYDIYEAALYQYHNHRSIHTPSELTTDDLQILRSLASEQQWFSNTPDGTDRIKAIAGQTLSSRILQELSHSIASGGDYDEIPTTIPRLARLSYQPLDAGTQYREMGTGALHKPFVRSWREDNSFIEYPTPVLSHVLPFRLIFLHLTLPRPLQEPLLRYTNPINIQSDEPPLQQRAPRARRRSRAPTAGSPARDTTPETSCGQNRGTEDSVQGELYWALCAATRCPTPRGCSEGAAAGRSNRELVLDLDLG